MNSNKNQTITVQTSINSDIDTVWESWTNPDHITKWNFASDDWRCPSAINNLQPGKAFNWRMESKDGKIGFDFMGTYQKIVEKKLISYKMADGRNVTIQFLENEDHVILTETFDTEGTNSDEQQRAGWQAILENFKVYTES